MNNYWFLYNLKDGSIYGSPYLGSAEEWTNIPDGCDVLGPFSEEVATEDIHDVFVNPTHYLVKGGKLVTVANYTDIKLQDVQATKIAEIKLAYYDALSLGFSSTINEVKYNFSYDSDSQNKFLKLLTSMNAGLISFPTTVFSKDSDIISVTEEQLKQLFKDLSSFELDLETKLHTYIAKVNSATTAEEVNAIIFE